MATHSGILAWRIPWTEEPGRLQSTGSQRVGYDRATNTFQLFNSYSFKSGEELRKGELTFVCLTYERSRKIYTKFHQVAGIEDGFFSFTHVKKSLLKDGIMKGICICLVKNLTLLKENINLSPQFMGGNLWALQIGVSLFGSLGSYWTV